jgi:hypothetical protein
VIGNVFIEVFEKEAETLGAVEFLLQGTLYPDVIESVSYRGPSATIKTHHVSFFFLVLFVENGCVTFFVSHHTLSHSLKFMFHAPRMSVAYRKP